MTARTERLTFTGSQGDTLAARLDLPPVPPAAYALFAHCFTCSKDVFAASRIANQLAERGIATLRFDFTGLGSSDGEFANTNFSSNVADLLAAVDFLRSAYAAPSLLIGHSLGGAAVLAAAGHVPEAKAVATIAAPADPGHVAHLLTSARPEIERAGEAEVELAGRRFRIKKQFLDDIEAQALSQHIADMRKALLVLHAPGDDIVGIENASQIFLAAKHPKSFVSLDGADHLLSRRADAIYVADLVAAWSARYIDVGSTPELNLPKPADGDVIVRETGEGLFSQHVITTTHLLRADEPVSVGGDASGPGPYDFLLAGLGACTAMTLRLYARRKELPLERVTVTLAHDRIHAEDCETCETKAGRVDRIKRRLEIEGPLDDAQRQRLREIADMCPVHRTLESEILIETELSG